MPLLEWDYRLAGMPAGVLAGQAPCAGGGRVPVEEPCTRRPERKNLRFFPSGLLFSLMGRVLSKDSPLSERKETVFNSRRLNDNKDVIVYGLVAV